MKKLKTRKINPNLKFLHEQFKIGKRGVLLEGSSRSAKTWSSIDFLIWICSSYENLIINIIKETGVGFQTTLHNDFNKRLPHFGIPSPFMDRKNVTSFNLLSNKINLLGADNPEKFHGAGCDIFWINEMIDVNKDIFDQSEMRCRLFWWGDYNPKASDHWIYSNVASRNDVGLLHSTFKDNPNISIGEKNKILSYEPTEFNIRNGTADDYLWNVYGLGLRSAPEGLIFQHVTWIKTFPEDIEQVFYGLDFGYTNDPSALVKVGVSGNNIFVQCLFYEPTPSFAVLGPVLKDLVPDCAIWADSSDPGMISDCRQAGLKVYAIKKFQGSIKYGIALLKQFKIHLVDHPAIRKEQSNYRYREINGIKLDEPIDDFNHFWDATRYAAIANLRKR